MCAKGYVLNDAVWYWLQIKAAVVTAEQSGADNRDVKSMRSIVSRTLRVLEKGPTELEGPDGRKNEGHLMYIFFEYTALLALTAVVATVLFAACAVFVTVEEGMAAVLRIPRKAASTGTRRTIAHILVPPD